VAGLAALVAWREEITTAGALARSLSGAGFGRSPGSCPCWVFRTGGGRQGATRWTPSCAREAAPSARASSTRMAKAGVMQVVMSSGVSQQGDAQSRLCWSSLCLI